LQFTPRTELHDGLASTVAWFREAGHRIDAACELVR
jgi:hypothetical protein